MPNRRPKREFELGSDPFNLEFKQPPGLLPLEVRKNLQGNIVPQVSPAMMRTPNWNANIFQTLSRLMIYGFGGLRWGFGILWDKFRGRDSIERRAVRLRKTIERIGGSAVKVGQQMAMRIDSAALRIYGRTDQNARPYDHFPDELCNPAH